MAKKDLLKHAAVHVLIGAILVLWVRFLFADNPQIPGLEDYWKHNIRYWLNPKSYFLFWDAYHVGLPIFPRGSNILLIAFTAFFVFYKWKDKPLQVKRLFIYTATFKIPLFIYGGWADEIRALSLMFPAIYLLGVYSLYHLIYPSASHDGKMTRTVTKLKAGAQAGWLEDGRTGTVEAAFTKRGPAPFTGHSGKISSILSPCAIKYRYPG